MQDRSRWIALVVLCTGMLMIVLDMTIVNVALPSIQARLGFSQAGLAWGVNAYLIAFAGLLPLAGRLGDLVGRRNVFLAGLGVFTGASLLCGLAANQEMLIAARFLQGMGGALTSAVILGMIVTMFSDPREQARAIGVFAFVASAGAAVGLLAGGTLTQFLNWHWIFFVNLPIGAATAVAAVRVLRPDRGAGLRAGADVPGALLVTAAMMLAVFTIVGPAAQQGWLAVRTLALGAGALLLLAGFILRQRTARNPLMPLRIFSSRNLAGANPVPGLGTAGMFGMFFLGSLYLRRILGYDPLQIGLAFLPVTVVMGALSVRYTDRLGRRFGARRLLFPGLRQLRRLRAAGHAAVRHRCRGVLPGADDARHVRCHREGRRAGLRPGEHDGPGRRRGGPRRAGDRVRLPDQRAARARPPGGGRPGRRLPPGILDRVRPGGRDHRGRRHGAAPAAPRCARAAPRSQAGSRVADGFIFCRTHNASPVQPPGPRALTWGPLTARARGAGRHACTPGSRAQLLLAGAAAKCDRLGLDQARRQPAAHGRQRPTRRMGTCGSSGWRIAPVRGASWPKPPRGSGPCRPRERRSSWWSVWFVITAQTLRDNRQRLVASHAGTRWATPARRRPPDAGYEQVDPEPVVELGGPGR